MKKVLKTLTAATMVAVMAVSFTACDDDDKNINISVGSPMVGNGYDYQKMIDSFVPNSFNTKELAVGEVDGPKARIWLQNGTGTVYTSNDKVVTVSELGKVTAVGPGQAYVVITGNGTAMFEVYQYTVVGSKEEKKKQSMVQIDV